MPCPTKYQFHWDPCDHHPPLHLSHAHSTHSPNHSPHTLNSHYHPPPVRRLTDTASTHPAEERWALSREAATPRAASPSLRLGSPLASLFLCFEPCSRNGRCLGHRFRPLGGGRLGGREGLLSELVRARACQFWLFGNCVMYPFLSVKPK